MKLNNNFFIYKKPKLDSMKCTKLMFYFLQ